MDLNDIYTELVMEHSRNQENRKTLDGDHVCEKRGYNPSCGDDITLQMDVEDGIIRDLAFSGTGCAISQASTSLMIDLLKGQTVEEGKRLCEEFIGMIKRENTDEDALIEDLGDAYAFQNISNMPSRVKCAVLSWHTLENMLEQEEQVS